MSKRNKSPRSKDAGNFLEKSGELFDRNKKKRAAQVLRDGLKAHPGDLRLSLRLGAMEMSQMNYPAALSVLLRALSANPNQPDLQYHIGMVHVSLGDGAAAQEYLEPIAGLHARDIPLQEVFGVSLSLQRKFDEALDVFERALGVSDNEGDAIRLQLHTVVVLQDMSRVDDALALVLDLKRMFPENTDILLAAARLYSDLGDADQAEECLRRVLDRMPANIEAFVMLHKILLRDADPAALEKIDAFLADAEIDDSDRSSLHFLAGEINDRLKAFDDAFEHFSEANRIRRKTSEAFDVRAHFSLVERTKSVFDRSFFEQLGGADQTSGGPIFIVGMPRSGTSLVEQILASHPDVYGAGEREEIAQISDSLQTRLGSVHSYPECLADLGAEPIKEIAAEYIDIVSAEADSGQRTTDKMPRNFLDVGLIRVLFPNARIVHCIRDPLDTCLSCFVSNFGRRQLFSTDFSDLAAYFKAYSDLMDHWDVVLDSPVYHLRYEDLVADPETQIPKLVEFCGLPWDERCLSPHLATRRVVTASRWQVRRPIYKSSVSRAQRYGSRFDPLRKALTI